MNPGFKLTALIGYVAAVWLALACCAPKADAAEMSDAERTFVRNVTLGAHHGAVAVAYGYWYDIGGKSVAEKVIDKCAPPYELAVRAALDSLPPAERTVGQFAQEMATRVAIVVQEACLRGVTS